MKKTIMVFGVLAVVLAISGGAFAAKGQPIGADTKSTALGVGPFGGATLNSTTQGLAGSLGAARVHQTASVRVPNVTGRYLDVAEHRLIAARLIPVERGGGIFGIIVKADWQVCIQTPRAGKRVAAGSRVKVFVSRPGRC